MSRPTKELIVKVGSETLKIREGESRTVHLPMTLRMKDGILFFVPPDVITEEVKIDNV